MTTNNTIYISTRHKFDLHGFYKIRPEFSFYLKNDIKTKANIIISYVIHAYKKDQITIFVFIPEEKKC